MHAVEKKSIIVRITLGAVIMLIANQAIAYGQRTDRESSAHATRPLALKVVTPSTRPGNVGPCLPGARVRVETRGGEWAEVLMGHAIAPHSSKPRSLMGLTFSDECSQTRLMLEQRPLRSSRSGSKHSARPLPNSPASNPGTRSNSMGSH
jgi:hypothetical protein